MLLALERNSHGPRLRFIGQRIHHGTVGLACAANGRMSVRFLGICLMAHDLRDWRSWLRFGWQD